VNKTRNQARITVGSITIIFPAETTFNVSQTSITQPKRHYKRHYKREIRHSKKGSFNQEMSRIQKASWANPVTREKRIAAMKAAKSTNRTIPNPATTPTETFKNK